MIHKLCGRCEEMESVVDMERLDDNYYCIGCLEEMVLEEEIEDDDKQLDV